MVDPLQPPLLSHDMDQITYTSSLLAQDELELLGNMFQCNKDIFAWTHSDMPGIYPVVASHELNISLVSQPVWKKIWRFHPNKQKIIQTKIDKLLAIRLIRKVKYLDWLANVVVVPKKDGRWRVCINYLNLNDVYPKNSFFLPRIDQIVDATTRHGIISFLDAFSGYHQIPMFKPDEEKTVFVMLKGLYCYRVMSFGLNNAGATY